MSTREILFDVKEKGRGYESERKRNVMEERGA